MGKWRSFAIVALLVAALGVAGCGGGGGGAAEEPAAPMPTPQEMCEADGGRYNADGTCTSAAELVMERQAAQRSAISTAIGTATTAVNGVDNDSTDAEVSAADTALENARSAIAAADDLSAAEKAANTGTVNALATVLNSAKTARMAAMDEADMAEKMAMMATAMKLHAGISPFATTGDAIRNVVYNATDNSNIDVTIGTADAVVLTEDKDATVGDNHGWQGQKFTASPDGDGTYEAVVYSNVGESTEGQKFSVAHPYDTTAVDGTDTELSVNTTTAEVQAKIASPSFDQSAGKKEFELPSNTVRVTIPGSYSGVSGTYYCTPTSGETCSASVAARGFTLANGTWTFRATNADQRLMDTPDAIYASYGWWIHKSEDGETFTASAFAADRGAVPDATGITALQGTATYMGGAAGKYALRSMTGGTNDAGHFTARATLEADFGDDMITGTIDNFIGADGKSRDWSVKLNETDIGDTGVIDGQDDASAEVGTVWSMGGTAAAKSGQWRGSLQNNGDDDVPMVGTGTFHSTFGADGNMVGAFGVNKQ